MRDMVTSLTNAAASAAVSTMIRQLVRSDITFQSDELLNRYCGREAVGFASEICDYELPVRIEAVISLSENNWHQLDILEIVGERHTDRRHALDVRMHKGKLSASVLRTWFVSGPELNDPEVVRFFEKIVEKGRKAKNTFTVKGIL